MSETEEMRQLRKQKFMERMAQKDKNVIHTEKLYWKNGDERRKPPQQRSFAPSIVASQNSKDDNLNHQSNKANPVTYKEKYILLNSLLKYQSLEEGIKKVMIIALTLLHCYQVFAIDSYQVLLSTMLFIELTSLLIKHYLRTQIKAITPNEANSKSTWRILAMIDDLMGNLSFVDSAFFIFNFLSEVIQDLSIVVSLSITSLLYNEYMTV